MFLSKIFRSCQKAFGGASCRRLPTLSGEEPQKHCLRYVCRLQQLHKPNLCKLPDNVNPFAQPLPSDSQYHPGLSFSLDFCIMWTVIWVGKV